MIICNIKEVHYTAKVVKAKKIKKIKKNQNKKKKKKKKVKKKKKKKEKRKNHRKNVQSQMRKKIIALVCVVHVNAMIPRQEKRLAIAVAHYIAVSKL